MKKSKPNPLKGREERYPKGWSYSAWGMFSKCMFQYYCVKILGFKEGTNRFLERGIAVHKMAEQFLKGAVTKLPNEFKPIEPEYRQLKRAGPIVEQFWGVTDEWKPSNFGSWVVMKMDAALPPGAITDNLLYVQDLKTGRQYPTHIGQAELYGCIGSALYPRADGVEAEFWYLDQGDIVSHTFDKQAIKFATKKWTERGKEILSKRKKWPASPSEQNCKYCFLKASEGGPCHDYWKGR